MPEDLIAAGRIVELRGGPSEARSDGRAELMREDREERVSSLARSGRINWIDCPIASSAV